MNLPAASLSRVLPFAVYIAFLALASLALNLQHTDRIPAGWDLRWLYAVKVGLVTLVLIVLRPRFVELAGPPRLTAAGWLLGVLAGVAIFVVWINLDRPWASFGPADGFDPRDAAGAIDWPLAAVRLLGAALVVPVMEELFWRSFVMRWIDNPNFLSVSPTAVSLRAILLSAVAFGFEHSLWLAGIIAGLAFGWLYRRTGNLWIAVVAHAVANAALGVWVLATGSWQLW